MICKFIAMSALFAIIAKVIALIISASSLMVTIKRLSTREVVANTLPLLDKVNIDNKDDKGDDESFEDEMLNIELWPVRQCTSYNGGGGRGQRPAPGREGGHGSTSGGIGRGGQ